MFNSLWPHGLQHTNLPCPSPSPGVHSNSCPLNQWCHLTISSSNVPFSSCLQSFPASESFPMSRLFVPGGQSTSIEWWNRLLKTQLSCHLGENTLWSWSNLLWACNIYVGWSANMGFPGGSVVKNPPASVGDTGSIPGSGRSLRKGNGNALQYSCLGNPTDRGSYSPSGHKRVGHDFTTKQQKFWTQKTQLGIYSWQAVWGGQ